MTRPTELIKNENFKELLLYWIEERYRIYEKKSAGDQRPWTLDPVFRQTYFCNVHRENDRVTKWIRKFYSSYVKDDMFEYNIVLSRFINWPPTLEHVGYQLIHEPEMLKKTLVERSKTNKIWGGAYIITTHGQPMGKIDYLVDQVLYDYMMMDRYIKYDTILSHAHGHLMEVPGIGSFLAAQIVADLKNTTNHPLSKAPDWYTFVAPGPGSLRGASWFHYGRSEGLTVSMFPAAFAKVREYVDAYWPLEIPPVCNQDLQNCLCEFDKYCRVSLSTGRSKRSYPG